MHGRIIAIDGPSASGKSSTGAEVARRLGFLHVDSGALYRAIAVVATEMKEDWTTVGPACLLREAERRGLRFQPVDGWLVPFLDGKPAESLLRTPRVTEVVSPVSAVPEVREWVNTRLRALAAEGQSIVMDGRDIGSVVFPDAQLKIFLTATPESRARRRLEQRGERVDEQAVVEEAARLAARDRADSQRAVAPLVQAPDAVVVDTTNLTFDQQVERIVALARERLGR
ncbi:MAG: (d)CMP kinase [Gemmatimonadota bacterium]